MPNSRATIAAGTSPPRVMQTIAVNGPASASRHASARASRWNWSHDTGNAFCGCAGSGAINGSDLQVDHEIESRRHRAALSVDLHQQLLAEQAVAPVRG